MQSLSFIMFYQRHVFFYGRTRMEHQTLLCTGMVAPITETWLP
ncbi:hypothetical protein SXCC_04579 [Gluconacetobacter sp. SXCC-1]|nr:hypothetical protein SXCC_04579 [Gluconacetobacter sp. SXCC-1]